MRFRIASTALIAGLVLATVGACSSDDESPATTSSTAAVHTGHGSGPSGFEGQTVGDFASTFWDEHANVVRAFSTNSVTELVLDESDTVDTTKVTGSFIIVTVLFCQPRQAFVYAVDPAKVGDKRTSAKYEKWLAAQKKSTMCSGKAPGTSITPAPATSTATTSSN